MLPSRCGRLSVLVVFLLACSSLPAYSQAALQFVAVAPCRVADTRGPQGPFGGPAMDALSTRDFSITQSTCNVPSTAAAFSLNVTVVPHGALHYLTIWPTGQAQPLVSTLNSIDGRAKANAAIVPAGSSGSVSVYVTDTTDVILDIDGYFIPADTTTLAFFPLTPCRVADTRGPQGPLGGPSLEANQTRIFPVPASSCQVPSSAQGYSLNITVVPAHPLGYLTLWPTGQDRPVVSTLNARTGTVVANAAVVPAGTAGAISVYVTDATDLLIDINGYFAPADLEPGQTPLSLFSLTPCRVVDTRQGGGLLNGVFPVDVLGRGCSVPSAQAYVFNATVVPNSGPMGYLSLWPDAEGQPVVSTLNARDGAVTSNLAIVPTLNGDVDAYAAQPAWLIMDVFGYFAPILPLNITTTSLPDGTANYNYRTTMLAAGGVLPYRWSLSSGDLPAGLALDPDSGVISGTPTITGDSSFTVGVTDSQSPPASASGPASIHVGNTVSQLTVTTTTLPNGTQNSPYSATLSATGGLTPYTWSLAQGSLPPGLTLNGSTGAITGTPSGGGISSFQVQVTDSELPTQQAIGSLSITISPAVPLSVNTASLPDGTQHVPYSAQVIAIGGVYPYTWSVTSGSLPAGLNLNSSTGAITGAPTGSGNFAFTVQVTDAETPPENASRQLSIAVSQLPPLVMTTTTLPDGTAGVNYSAQLAAGGGFAPYSWSVIAGKLPDGLSLNNQTGLISGTPALPGPKDMTVQVTDSEQPPASVSRQFTFTINPPSGGNCDGTPSSLSGNYAFYLNGFNGSGAFTMVGSYVADGQGHITGGIADGNSITGPPFTTSITGTYCINRSGLHTMTLHGSSWGPVTFAFMLNSDNYGQLIEYDDTTGHGSRGSGEFRHADSSAFSLGRVNGNWIFGVTGAALHSDNSVKRFVDVGRFTLTNSSMTAGTCYSNDGGDFETCTFTGTVSSIDPQTGRASITAQTSHGPNHLVAYVVNPYQMMMASSDSVPSTRVPLQVGPLVAQSGSFNNGSLNGRVLILGEDIHGSDGLMQSFAILSSLDGMGHFTGIAQDEDTGGTITQRTPDSGTYTVQSNGSVTFNCAEGGCPVGFLYAPNKGWIVGTGTSTVFGDFGPQTGGPFSNASISGTYLGGSLPPLDYITSDNQVNVLSANGAGAFSISGFSSNSNGLDQYYNSADIYGIASNGRGTTPDGHVLYVASPNFFIVMSIHADAQMEYFQK